MGETRIDIYPVVVLAELLWIRGCLQQRQYREAVRRASRVHRGPLRNLRARKWRNLKNCFNGYLAEISYPPAEIIQRTCGHGWTKRRAARRMGEYLWRDNQGDR